MKKLSFARRGRMFSFLCVLPWLAGLVLFTLWPIWETLTYSFSRNVFLTDGTIQKTFVGWENYFNAFVNEGYFRIATLEYLQQVFLLGPLILVFSLLIALALNRAFRGRSFYRAVFFMPIIFLQGPLLAILRELGGMEITGIQEFFVFRILLTGTPEVISTGIDYVTRNFSYVIWYSGVQQLLMLAGLQKIDSSMYEAAAVDGASAWQRFWKITLPVLRPYILLSGIYTVLDLSISDMNPIISLIRNFMLTKANGFGYSGAITFMYLLLILLCVGVYAAVIMLRRRDKEVRT